MEYKMNDEQMNIGSIDIKNGANDYKNNIVKEKISIYKLDENNNYIPLTIFNRYYNTNGNLVPTVININGEYYAFVSNKVLNKIQTEIKKNDIEIETETADYLQVYESKDNRYISKYVYDKYYYGEQIEIDNSITINNAKYYQVSQSIIDRIIVSNPNLNHKYITLPMLDLVSTRIKKEKIDNLKDDNKYLQEIKNNLNKLRQENNILKEQVKSKDKIINDLIKGIKILGLNPDILMNDEQHNRKM